MRQPAGAPDGEVARLLATVCRRLGRLLSRRGLDLDAGESAPRDPLVEASGPLAGLSSASVLGRIALGPRRHWPKSAFDSAPTAASC